MNNIIFKTILLKGEAGNDIQSVEKTDTSGLVDTYTITLTDGSTSTFQVTNGKSIVSIEKTSSVGYVDTYTITYNDGTTDTFEITLATVTIDDALSDTSTNPVENRVVTDALATKASETRVNEVYRATKGMIAPSETSPAIATHVKGEYITFNGKMYEVIDPIAIGDTLSSSNISETNTGEELSQINADLSESLTWKSVGNLAPSGTLALPNNFRELLVDFTITLGAENVRATLHLPKEVLGGVFRYYRTGYYANSNSNASFSVESTTTQMKSLNVWQNNTDLTNQSGAIICEVYYR